MFFLEQQNSNGLINFTTRENQVTTRTLSERVFHLHPYCSSTGIWFIQICMNLIFYSNSAQFHLFSNIHSFVSNFMDYNHFCIWIQRKATSTRIIKHSIQIMLIRCTYILLFVYWNRVPSTGTHTQSEREHTRSGLSHSISTHYSRSFSFFHFVIFTSTREGVTANGCFKDYFFSFYRIRWFTIYCYCNCILFGSFCSFRSLKIWLFYFSFLRCAPIKCQPMLDASSECVAMVQLHFLLLNYQTLDFVTISNVLVFVVIFKKNNALKLSGIVQINKRKNSSHFNINHVISCYLSFKYKCTAHDERKPTAVYMCAINACLNIWIWMRSGKMWQIALF